MFFRQSKITNALKMQVNQLQVSLSSFRDELAMRMGISHGGNRDLYKEFGYKHEPSFSDLYSMATTHPMGHRLVFGMPKLCWRDGFKIYQNAKDESTEVFEVEVLKLNRRGMATAIEKADSLSRIGNFACLFVGVPDGLDTSQQVGRARGNAINSVYFKAFAADAVTITEFDRDIKSPRYGLPLMYQVETGQRASTGEPTETRKIHHSRIVHMVNESLDSDIEGLPYLTPIYNTLNDILKTCGGSAEAYFRNAQRIIVTEIDPEFASTLANDEGAKKALNDKAKEFTNKMQNQLMTAGGKTTQLQANHASPLDTFNVLVYSVCAYSGYPVRFFTGEGGGQYSGEEDQLAMANIVGDRQNSTCAAVAYSVFDILAKASIVQFTGDEEVVFNAQLASTESKRAEIAATKAKTLLDVTSAKSNIGGDEIDLASTLVALGLDEIKLETIEAD